MILVGLSGGIGSGKSTVAGLLESRGAVVVDADRIGHEVLAPGGPGEAPVLERFGTGIRGPDGAIDRSRLREVVFADSAARRELEAIVHPLIYAEISRRLALDYDAGTVVVVDAPLLVETGARSALPMQALVVVAAEEPEQIRRVVARGAMTAGEASAVLAAQAPAERKMAAADYVIMNRGSLAELEAGVETLWEDLLARFGGPLPD